MNWGSWGITFDRPGYLVWLAVAPLLWYLGRNSLAGLGPVRRLLALTLRIAAVVLLVCSIAEVQWVRTSNRLTVIYLLDQSLSIPPPRRAAMVEYVNAAISQHRQRDDKAGVIVFGREAAVEIPPLDAAVPLDPHIESVLDREHTHIASALKLALASFPEDSSRRIVVISDGNETIGDALEQARRATEGGVGIDVVPVVYRSTGEVAVEKITLPADVRKGTPFDLRIVLNNLRSQATADPAETVRGRLIVSQRTDDQPRVISDQSVELPPGKRVFTLREQIDQPNFYNYEARFVSDDPSQDGFVQNNRATAHTHIRGSGQVLLIEDRDHRGEHNLLVERLRLANLEVTIQPSDQAFGSLAELQPFDTVLLANVPREHFSEEQVAMLERNCHDLGSGLIMLGGPNSFGAGGWANTPVERAMPVDFEIKNAKVIPSGALALVIDCSGSMTGLKMDMSSVAAVAAVRVLGDRDQVGVVTFDSAAHVLVPMQPAAARERIARLIARLAPGGGTDMMPGMIEGYRGLQQATAAMKHMIVLTDGQTMGEGYEALAARMQKLGITTTTVAVGVDAAVPLLQGIASAGAGKFYAVRDPHAIPRIFMQEARRVARPLIYEDERGVIPKLSGVHEVTTGLGAEVPPLTGFVMTTVKSNPLVEVSIKSPPLKGFPDNDTILASWTYGLGKVAAYTSDVGARWAKAWDTWSGYDKLFSQLVRWSMRSSGETGQFSVASDLVDGRMQLVVTALDSQDEFLNFLDLGGTVIDPAMKSQPLPLKQVAPGRYVGSFEAQLAGSYFMALGAGPERAPLRMGINVPYSREFRDRVADERLLQRLAELKPPHGERGQVIRDPSGQDQLDALLSVNSFRHDLPASRRTSDAWPTLLWIAGLVFFGDVFIRRVAVNLNWIPSLTANVRDRLWRRTPVASDSAIYLDRLRSRKQEVTQSLSQRHAGLRAEPEQISTTLDATLPLETSESSSTTLPANPPPTAALAPQDTPAADDYTKRLLKAKQKVWQNRDQDKPHNS